MHFCEYFLYVEMSRLRFIPIFLGAIGTASILFFGYVMATMIWPYMAFEHAKNFLGTKTDEVLAKSHFQWAFYIHITTSWFVMMVGLVQMFPVLARKAPIWHRRLGIFYILSILLLAAPSGLVLAMYANGGLAARVGFSLQSIIWWLFTLAAWHEIRQHRYKTHIEWMLRSYAITMAAMSLRTESYLMHYWLGTKPIETYLTVTWLSWVGNWLLAECLIYLGIGGWMLRQATKNKGL
jgi:hypothetical protein